MITGDIIKYIDRKFAADLRASAHTLIEMATLPDGSSAGVRLLRCAVVASSGSLDKLRHNIEQLSVDSRDVILAGEYATRDGQLVRVRDLNEPIDEGD